MYEVETMKNGTSVVTEAIWRVQVVVIVLAVITAVTLLAMKRPVNVDTVIAGLFGISGAVIGAGAVAHGVRQGSKATADPPPTE